MIKDRPHSLEKSRQTGDDLDWPLVLNFDQFPDLMKHDLEMLEGIMPVTSPLIEVVGTSLSLQPGAREVEYYRHKQTKFQMVNVVVNACYYGDIEGEKQAVPYAVSLVPATKKGKVQTVTIDWIDKVNLEEICSNQAMYSHFNPFSGAYGLYGRCDFRSEQYLDEIGFVTGCYFLAEDVMPGDMLFSGPNFSNKKLNTKYIRHRRKRYYTPFKSVKPRRVWGVDSPIELFLMQGLANKGAFASLQTIFLTDGSIYASHSDMISQQRFHEVDEFLTEVDFYFDDSKLAVFCDSNQYHKARRSWKKDERISSVLKGLGVKSIRLSGGTIVNDLDDAVSKVLEAM